MERINTTSAKLSIKGNNINSIEIEWTHPMSEPTEILQIKEQPQYNINSQLFPSTNEELKDLLLSVVKSYPIPTKIYLYEIWDQGKTAYELIENALLRLLMVFDLYPKLSKFKILRSYFPLSVDSSTQKIDTETHICFELVYKDYNVLIVAYPDMAEIAVINNKTHNINAAELTEKSTDFSRFEKILETLNEIC